MRTGQSEAMRSAFALKALTDLTGDPVRDIDVDLSRVSGESGMCRDRAMPTCSTSSRTAGTTSPRPPLINANTDYGATEEIAAWRSTTDTLLPSSGTAASRR
jgi:hypothetical protein